MTLSIRTNILLFCSILSISVSAQSEAYKTTPSGVKYKVIPSALPETGDYVYFHAQMRTQRDSIMFSTWGEGGELPVVRVPALSATVDDIGPVEDVLRYLRLGERAEVIADFKDFPNKPTGLEEDTIIYYDVQVMEIISAEEYDEREAIENLAKEKSRALAISRSAELTSFHKSVTEKYRSGNMKNIVTTDSGLKYVIHEKGEGSVPESGEEVTAHYIGSLVAGGEPFDASFQRGDPIKFSIGLGRVIPGWEEGLQLLPRGTKATLFIPAVLAYGADGTPDGSIPPNTEITYYIELE